MIFHGLKYGDDNVSASQGNSSYFITEIEAPTYEEDGTIKHYSLLSSPVEVKVNSTSEAYSQNTVKVINKKEFILPITGATGTISLLVVGSILIAYSIKRKKKM